MKKLILTGIILLAFSLPAFNVYALTLGFERITNNNVEDVAGQLFVDININSDDPAKIDFKFYNNGPVASNITEIYFDDGALTGPPAITNSSGVSFVAGATPSNLPSGNTLNPPFIATTSLLAEAGGNNATGVGIINEYVILTYLGNFALVQNALNSGDLRIGLHVRSIGTQGGSDSFVNNDGQSVNVPEPGIILMLGFGLVGIALARRKEN